MKPRQRSGSVACLSIALAAALAITGGCDDSTTAFPEVTECCISDPAPHHVDVFDCIDDASCPNGTVCVPADGYDADWPRSNDSAPLALEACRGTRGERVCALPPTRSGNRQALTKGFHVGAFKLRPAEGDEFANRVAFTWTPPKGARVVHCALFACRPVVRERKEEGEDLREIVNYPGCVLASEIFDSASGVFDLANADLERAKPQKGDRCPAVGPRRISELAVGCWAYDATQIIAATPMEVISGAGIYNYQKAFADTCLAETEGASCLLPEERIGACHLDECRELCVDNADCSRSDVITSPVDAGADVSEAVGDAAIDVELPDSSRRRQSPSTPETPPYCSKVGDNYIGVCIPVPKEGGE